MSMRNNFDLTTMIIVKLKIYLLKNSMVDKIFIRSVKQKDLHNQMSSQSLSESPDPSTMSSNEEAEIVSGQKSSTISQKWKSSLNLDYLHLT